MREMRAPMRRQVVSGPVEAAVEAAVDAPPDATSRESTRARLETPPGGLTPPVGRAESDRLVGPVRAELAWAMRTAVVPWLIARVVVGGALVFARELVTRAHPLPSVAARVHEGLLGWDAGWYESIARHGYAGAGHASLRFFPLVPLLARALSSLPGVGVGPALVVVANVSAFVGVVLLVVLARRETGDRTLARRAAWLMCLAPAAFTQVMGYAEGTLLALSVGTMLALRARAWWWAGLLGLGAAATRPLGVLLVVPAVVEALRGLRGAPLAQRAARAGAVVGPAAGLAAFLGWVAWRYGDAWAPFRVQQQGTLRGRPADPVRTLAHDAALLVHGRHLGSALHLPWALLALALLVVALRRWPVAYGVFAAAVLVAALTASNLDGFERYSLSAFPLVLAGASVTSKPGVERTVFVLAAAGLAIYAMLAFTNLYVP